MYGIDPQLTDPSLYLLADMTEDLLASTETQMIETVEIELKEALNSKVSWYKNELAFFERNIEEKRKQSFQFSLEELFYHHGQYDNFVNLDFHKYSEAAKKFGRTISGTLVYGKQERRELQNTVAGDTMPRTNGLVKIRVTPNSLLNEDIAKELLEKGFKSDDVYQVWSTNGPKNNAYTKEGQKEIPHTIFVNLPGAKTSIAKLSIYTFNLRLSNGATLIDSEWNRYYGFSIYVNPRLKNENGLKNDLFDNHGKLKPEIRFYELGAKAQEQELSIEETEEFKNLLIKRREGRFKILEEELKRAGIPSIDKFRLDHPNIYIRTFAMAVLFEDESFNGIQPGIPVFVDFKSYLHIFLGHQAELQPTGAFKEKTTFSYDEKDVRRILKVAIEKYWLKIQERLSQGKDFRVYGEKAFYFNGNYYSFRIEPNGRVSTFYANENNNPKI